MLITDIYETKSHSLTTSCTIYVIVCDVLVFVPIAYGWYFNYIAIKYAAFTGKYEYSQNLIGSFFNVSDIVGNPALLEAVVDSLFFTSIYCAILFTSLSIAIICLSLGNEFNNCTEELSQFLTKESSELVSHFQDIKNRFQYLVGLVGKVNNHYSFYIGYNVSVSLFIICAMSYAITLMIKDPESPMGMIPIMFTPVLIMASNVLLLTGPVSFLHTKVNNKNLSVALGVLLVLLGFEFMCTCPDSQLLFGENIFTLHS